MSGSARQLKIFFSGIGGSGVSAIAGFMANKGHVITGSDRLFDTERSHPVRLRLEKNGIRIVVQDGLGIDTSYDFAVFSTAVESTNPDYLKARALAVPVKTRPAYLAEIVAQYETIAVAGTSGKSTISGMLAYLMKRLGLEPNFIGGGRVKQFVSETNPGNYAAGNSDYLVVEACESDGSIVTYMPAHAIIANLDLDHHAISETARMFRQLSGNTPGIVAANADDDYLASWNLRGTTQFSIERPSPCQAVDIAYHKLRTAFRVRGQDFGLSLPGRHNLYNALACIALLSALKVPLRDIARILPEFSGIERRFDIHVNTGRQVVIDDYAHNPHKIASLMETVNAMYARVCYIFQPHGFGPTRLMKNGYIETFIGHLRGGDRLVLLPIYYAGGTAAKDIASEDIAAPVRAAGRSATAVNDRGEVLRDLGTFDAYVVFGARDDSLAGLAEAIAGRAVALHEGGTPRKQNTPT